MLARPRICALIEAVGAEANILARTGGFFGLWLMISSGSLSDFPVGLAVAAAAAWASVKLLPSGASRPNLVALATIALRFPGQAVIAGADVARRALDPRLAAFSRFPCLSGAPAERPGAQRLRHANWPPARNRADRVSTKQYVRDPLSRHQSASGGVTARRGGSAPKGPGRGVSRWLIFCLARRRS